MQKYSSESSIVKDYSERMQTSQS